MRRIDRLDGLRGEDGPLHLALGVFDGVHVGHQAVIGEAVRAARISGGRAFVVTFDPHPIWVLAPEKAPKALLARLDEKAEIMVGLGVDGLLVIHFDRSFAEVEAGDFLRELCAGEIATIAVGEDWRFGKNRVGDVDFLREMSERYGYDLVAVAPLIWDGERISSTRIRQALRDGNMVAVSEMLGRGYWVGGVVVEGRRLGRELGFPTANIELGDLQVPMQGVWSVRGRIEGGDEFQGVANLGTRPTVDGEERLLEVHLFDFSGELYGREMRVEFVRFLRGERKFGSLEELKERISLDVAEARKDFTC